MMDEPAIANAVTSAIEAYDGSRARLDAVLHLLFVYGPPARQSLAADGRITLEQLRADDAATAGQRP